MDEEITMLEQNWDKYDFFFVHIKKPTATAKTATLTAKSALSKKWTPCARVLALDPDVLIITGDHSTPAKLKSHSWHPVPTLLQQDLSAGRDCDLRQRACAKEVWVRAQKLIDAARPGARAGWKLAPKYVAR